MKELILLGAGGHAKACLDVINSKSNFRITFLVGKNSISNSKIFDNKKIISQTAFNKKIKKIKKNIFIAIGQLKNGENRKKLFNFYKKKNFTFPIIISSNAYVSQNTEIGEGTILMHKTTINTNSKIGKNCIINTGSIIEHDVLIEDHVHIAPGAIILGGSIIRQNSFVGAGAVIKQNSIISKNSIVGSKKYFNK